MQADIGKFAIVFAAALTLAACNSDRTPRLMHLRSSHKGPDEFGILPTKPLEMPGDPGALPAPTPGGANLTDPTPEADAVAALGGNPERLTRNGNVPDRDRALILAASHHGVQSDIRQILAAEDLQWRKDHDGRLLERVIGLNLYHKAYKPMELDQMAELERWRKLGVRTPAVPPPADTRKPGK